MMCVVRQPVPDQRGGLRPSPSHSEEAGAQQWAEFIYIYNFCEIRNAQTYVYERAQVIGLQAFCFINIRYYYRSK